MIGGRNSLRPRSDRDPREFVGSAADRAVDNEQELVGSLNIYSQTASAFDPFDEELMRLYTVAAGQAISNSGRWQHSRETVTQLEQALISRSDIDMAKGALIALHGCESNRGVRQTGGRIPKAQHQSARRRPRNARQAGEIGLAAFAVDCRAGQGRGSMSAPEGIRTPNLLIRSQMLYPLSYGRMYVQLFGGGERI